MSRPVQAVVLVMLGAVAVYLSLSGEYLNYVRPGLGPYLTASGVFFAALGVAGMVRDAGRDGAARLAADSRAAAARARTHRPTAAPAPTVGHDHRDDGSGWYAHGVGWLLCVPLFVILVVPPPALGSYAAGRAGAAAPHPPARVAYPALPATSEATGPVTLPVRDYAMRAVWDGGRTLAGRDIALTGFVTAPVGGVWYLARMHVVCCAADAVAAKVQVTGVGRRYPTNAWVTVTGVWEPSDPHDLHGTVARLRATGIRAVARPANPYE